MLDTITGSELVLPFLHILKSTLLTGPFKLAAIDTIQCMLLNNAFAALHPSQICNTLTEIISVICKYVYIHANHVVISNEHAYILIIIGVNSNKRNL